MIAPGRLAGTVVKALGHIGPARGRAPDLCEYLVRVEWLTTRPVDEAVSEKGMFANQNTVCRLSNRFTLDRLIDRFGLAT